MAGAIWSGGVPGSGIAGSYGSSVTGSYWDDYATGGSIGFSVTAHGYTLRETSGILQLNVGGRLDIYDTPTSYNLHVSSTFSDIIFVGSASASNAFNAEAYSSDGSLVCGATGQHQHDFTFCPPSPPYLPYSTHSGNLGGALDASGSVPFRVPVSVAFDAYSYSSSGGSRASATTDVTISFEAFFTPVEGRQMATSVPEPASLGMLAMTAGLCLHRRRA